MSSKVSSFKIRATFAVGLTAAALSISLGSTAATAANRGKYATSHRVHHQRALYATHRSPGRQAEALPYGPEYDSCPRSCECDQDAGLYIRAGRRDSRCIVRPADECLLQSVPGHSVNPIGRPAVVSWSTIRIASRLRRNSGIDEGGRASSPRRFSTPRLPARLPPTDLLIDMQLCGSCGSVWPICHDHLQFAADWPRNRPVTQPSSRCHDSKYKSAASMLRVGYQHGTQTKAWRFSGEHLARGISTDGFAGPRRRGTIAAANQCHEAAIGRHAAGTGAREEAIGSAARWWHATAGSRGA